MRKSTLLSVAMLASSVTCMWATPAQTARASRSLETATEVFTSTTRVKAPAYVSSNPDDYEVLTEAPAGKKVVYLEDADVYFQMFGDIFKTSDIGITREVIFAEDGSVYFHNFISGATTDSYIKGVRNGNKIKFDFPQAIGYIEDKATGEKAKTFVYRIKHSETDNYADFSVYPIAEQSIEFTISDDEKRITWDDTTDFVGMCTFEGGWYGIGAWNYSFNKFEGTLVDFPPAGVPREDWTLIYDAIPDVYLTGGTRDVKIAIDETTKEVYLGGLLPDNLTWIKGSIADNKVTFPSGQYLGQNEDNEYTFFMGATGEIIEDSKWHVPTLKTTPLEALIFELNTETKTLKIIDEKHMISLNRGSGKIYGDYLCSPVAQKQNPELVAGAPQAPRILAFENFGGNSGMFNYMLSNINEKYMIQNTDNLFYNIYFNDKLYTLTRDDYPELGFATLTDIPYSYRFDDMSDAFGVSILFYWYNEEPIETAGIQAFYVDPATGEKYYSEKVTYTVAGVEKVETDAAVKSSHWYDLCGRAVMNPAGGIYIKVETLTNGETRTSKVAIHE